MAEIAFVAGYMVGKTSGASKAAVDALIALLLTGNQVTVISHTGRRCRLPEKVEGRDLPRPHWITPPRALPKWIVPGYPRQLAGWLLSAVQDPLWQRRLRRKPDPDLTIIYGLNYPLFEQVTQFYPNLSHKTAMVVQGSAKEETFQAAVQSLDSTTTALAKQKYLIFASSRCQRDWLSFPELAGKKSFYIPNCCQEDVASRLLAQNRVQTRLRLGLPQDRLVAVCVGSVQHRKGQDLLLAHFADLLEVAPDLVLYLIGPVHSSWAHALRRQIHESPLRHRLHVLGAKANAMEYTYAADLLVLPSRAEAMPLTILEAMALGTPVIASDVDGIPELIEHGRSGLLFSHNDTAGLVDAFEQMANQPDCRRALAEKASQRYWSTFSREHQIQRYREAVALMLSDG